MISMEAKVSQRLLWRALIFIYLLSWNIHIIYQKCLAGCLLWRALFFIYLLSFFIYHLSLRTGCSEQLLSSFISFPVSGMLQKSAQVNIASLFYKLTKAQTFKTLLRSCKYIEMSDSKNLPKCKVMLVSDPLLAVKNDWRDANHL